MSILHLCNIHFERELSGDLPENFTESFFSDPFFLQLQFLPLAFADEGDGILVSALPEEKVDIPLFLPEDYPSYSAFSTWGYSKMAKTWADEKGIDYPMPPWEVVRMVNSKAYSFSHSPLPDSHLIYFGDPLPKDCVLKNCYGTAGRGHIFSSSPKAQIFCEKEWKKGLPVIAEPWVERVCDFSTQWEIHQDKSIEFLGITFCTTSPTGVHKSNIAGDAQREKAFAPFIIEQKEAAQVVLKEMAEIGYFGNVGFDAFVFSKDKLQPICEINARKTMGWVALKMQRKHHANERLELSYPKSNEAGILPMKVGNTRFSRQLKIHLS